MAYFVTVSSVLQDRATVRNINVVNLFPNTAPQSVNLDIPPRGCYDVGFPEMAMIVTRKGTFALVYLVSFNTTTGLMPKTLQASAGVMHYQGYIAFGSPARDTTATYHA